MRGSPGLGLRGARRAGGSSPPAAGIVVGRSRPPLRATPRTRRPSGGCGHPCARARHCSAVPRPPNNGSAAGERAIYRVRLGGQGRGRGEAWQATCQQAQVVLHSRADRYNWAGTPGEWSPSLCAPTGASWRRNKAPTTSGVSTPHRSMHAEGPARSVSEQWCRAAARRWRSPLPLRAPSTTPEVPARLLSASPPPCTGSTRRCFCR